MVTDNFKLFKIIGDKTQILTKVGDQKYWSRTLFLLPNLTFALGTQIIGSQPKYLSPRLKVHCPRPKFIVPNQNIMVPDLNVQVADTHF